MNFRNSRIRKPDPLFLLALLVALGVVVTTSAQADDNPVEHATGADTRDAGAWLTLGRATELASRLDLHWLNSSFDRAEVNHLVSKKRVEIARPFGGKGPVLGMSVRPNISASAAAAGDSGIGAIAEDRPDLFFSLRRGW